ncbi:MAG: Rpn family recombination-promoting nuclease/putative transposase [Treponema sp.]|nr:Rpn family recombination-promoting nuclease/putative transposase [Treponema sp.]
MSVYGVQGQARHDNVFKAVFARKTPESLAALSHLISAITARSLTVKSVIANEPPIDNLHDRQIRFDIHAEAENGELVDVEMSLNPDTVEPVRLEFYGAKLFTGQDIRGTDYNELKAAYQIAMLAKGRFFDDDSLVHSFEYYDPERRVSLGGRSRIVTLELMKVVVEKPVSQMGEDELWAVYFRYLTDRGKRGKINEVIAREEGIAMASKVLVTISKDEVERARLVSEFKYEMDMQSKVTQAKRDGIQEVARKMKKRGLPIDQITEDTGLSPEEIATL